MNWCASVERNDVYRGLLHSLYPQFRVCPDRLAVHTRTVQSADGFVRQTLLMAHLFVLIRYGFGIEATRNITPGCEPTTEEAWDAVDSEKMVSQPVIYLFFMIIGQLGTWLTAWLAYAYEWQYVYHFMMAFMLAGIIIVFFTMPYHKYPMPKFPITLSKFGNVTVFSIMLCSFAYVMVSVRRSTGLMIQPSVSLRWSVLSLPLCSSIWRRRGVHLISSWRCSSSESSTTASCSSSC